MNRHAFGYKPNALNQLSYASMSGPCGPKGGNIGRIAALQCAASEKALVLKKPGSTQGGAGREVIERTACLIGVAPEMADAEGFEPPDALRVCCFQDSRIKPLSHASMFI